MTPSHDWTAPEHRRIARNMRRDRNGNLVIDPLPVVMRRPLRVVWRRRPITVKAFEAMRRAA